MVLGEITSQVYLQTYIESSVVQLVLLTKPHLSSLLPEPRLSSYRNLTTGANQDNSPVLITSSTVNA